MSSQNSQKSEDHLQNFLHRYQPLPPPERGELEEQIWQAIDDLPIGKRTRFWSNYGKASAAIATSFLLGIGGYMRWSAQLAGEPLSRQELAHLDRFLQESWEGVVVSGESGFFSVEDPWFLWDNSDID